MLVDDPTVTVSSDVWTVAGVGVGVLDVTLVDDRWVVVNDRQVTVGGMP